MGFRKCLKIWKWLYRGERFLGDRLRVLGWRAVGRSAGRLPGGGRLAYALKAQGLRAQGSRFTRSRLKAYALKAQGSRLKRSRLKAQGLRAR